MKPGTGRNRRGSLLTEAFVALVLLGALVSVVGQSTVRLTRQATLSRQHLVALEILTNQLERACALSNAEAKPGIQPFALAESAQGDLPDASCAREWKELDGGWHVTVTLHWRNAFSPEPIVVSLASWIPRATVTGTARVEPPS